MNTDTISTIEGTIIDGLWTKFFKISGTSWINNANTSQYMGPAQFMGYTSAAIAFFLSCTGAYQAASAIIADITTGMDNWLENFSNENSEKYNEVINDSERSLGMQQFIN